MLIGYNIPPRRMMGFGGRGKEESHEVIQTQCNESFCQIGL